MLSLKEILTFYPAGLQKFRQFIFKEYLQYLILQIIFGSKYANKLSFLWWTALRIVHNNARFSEDIDFDNFGLTQDEFEDLSKILKNNLEKNWFEVEIKNVYKWAYRCNIKIPKILKDLGFSELSEEKILIHIDTVPHHFEYKPDVVILNSFGMVFSINVTPIGIITSQKIAAIFGRKRPKWRDFFDLVFLLSKTSPDVKYLKQKLWYNSLSETKIKLLEFCEKLDFDELTRDVEIFLFDENGKNNLKYFKEIVEKSLI